ncbi:MAG: TVP38/TMEM64 family protein, partial [Nitrospiraceae bacterium]
MRKFIQPKFLIRATVILLLVAAFYMVGQSVDFEEFLSQDQLIAALESAGPFAPLVLILTMTVAVVVSPIPSLPLDLAAGAAFGPFLGMIYAVTGAELGAILSFLIGRALGRELLSKLLRVDVVFCEMCSDHKLMVLVFLARLLPIFSFDIVSYGAGLTNMSLKVFAIATLLGMILPTFALTYFGSSVVTTQWPLILLGALMVGVLVFLPKLLVKYRSSWWAGLFMGAAAQEDLAQASPAA